MRRPASHVSFSLIFPFPVPSHRDSAPPLKGCVCLIGQETEAFEQDIRSVGYASNHAGRRGNPYALIEPCRQTATL
jgi:hypothetical protein